jgi:peptidylprolyl isomerase
MPKQAVSGDTVRVHYKGRVEDGDEFDSSEGGEPLEFKLGGGDVIAGFDSGIVGMDVGEKKTIEIEAVDAYGERNESMIQTVPRKGLKLDTEPAVGAQIHLQLPDGNQIPVAITQVTDESVTLDANHPLAGFKLIFDVELLTIAEAE